jgi:mycothiol synthase
MFRRIQPPVTAISQDIHTFAVRRRRRTGDQPSRLPPTAPDSVHPVSPTVREVDRLDDAQRDQVRALADKVRERDGQPPFSDQALAHLGSDRVLHVVAEDGRLVGYGQSDGEGAELAGEPEALEPLLGKVIAAAKGPLLVWSHGSRSALGPVLQAAAFAPERALHQLSRELADVPPDAPLAEGITIRAFVPGTDEDAWLEVNAAAFAAHAEQGRWVRDDLLAREAEPWFDAAGFLLAERAGRLVGFHWTKVHPSGDGEVYVLGVHPDAQGLGLGPALLTRGLHHLAERGCPRVLLYVDESNATAMRLYERTGFARVDVDTQWRGPTNPPA